jgi:5-methylcytosine-specific restriction endonuclease McrA
MAEETNETRSQRQYRRLRERMTADPEYRERKLAIARAAQSRYTSRHHDRLLREQRERDRVRYRLKRNRILARRREEYVGVDLLERYERSCAYCGSTEGIEADHRTPLSRGGPNTIDNILPACRNCNRRKFRRTEKEFRELLAQEGAHDHGGVVGDGSGP